MVLAERTGTPDQIFEEPPFEKRGVCIVETDKKKIIYIPPLTQEEIDGIALASADREFLDSREMQNLNLAKVIYANTHLPWGFGLMNRAGVIRQVNDVVTKIDSILKSYNTSLNREKYRPIFGITGYIKADLRHLTIPKSQLIAA